MAKAIHQFRYYSDASTETRNYPGENEGYSSQTLKQELANGKLFNGDTSGKKYLPILQLGIQSIPGTQFRLNGGQDPIIIGSTGIYELDLDNGVEITDLVFDGSSLQQINESPAGYLIIDIIYENGEV